MNNPHERPYEREITWISARCPWPTASDGARSR
jgi:hypothetical protein